MQVRFRTDQLQQAFENQARRVRLWGEQIARRYVQRVQILQAAESVDDLFKIPSLKLHPLAARRKGQYALVLQSQMRLIISFGDPAMTAVWVEEVSNHYD